MIDAAERERQRDMLIEVLAEQGGVDFLVAGQADDFIDAALEKWGTLCANEALERAAQMVELTTARSEGRDTTAAAIRRLKAEG